MKLIIGIAILVCLSAIFVRADDEWVAPKMALALENKEHIDISDGISRTESSSLALIYLTEFKTQKDYGSLVLLEETQDSWIYTLEAYSTEDGSTLKRMRSPVIVSKLDGSIRFSDGPTMKRIDGLWKYKKSEYSKDRFFSSFLPVSE